MNVVGEIAKIAISFIEGSYVIHPGWVTKFTTLILSLYVIFKSEIRCRWLCATLGVLLYVLLTVLLASVDFFELAI
jgi:hypothetical protein